MLNSLEGMLSGVPSEAAQAAPQPLRFSFYASAQNGSELVWRNGTVMIAIIPKNLRPGLTPIGDNTMAVVGDAFEYDISSNFVDPEKDMLTFTLRGLPSGSGLSISAEGVISGLPSPADALAAQPLNLTVMVKDRTHLDGVQQSFLLSVAATSVLVGEPLSLYVASLFEGQAGAGNSVESVRDYSLVNMPLGSGLRISNRGSIEGTPSPADLFAPQPLAVRASATARVCTPLCTDKILNVDFRMRIEPILENSAPAASSEGYTILAGAVWSLNLTTTFPDPEGHTVSRTATCTPMTLLCHFSNTFVSHFGNCH
jgi:hypothetical protein